MTIVQYDVAHLKKTITNTVVGVLIVAGIHYKWEMIQPLFLQIFMIPMQLYKNPLFKIYLLGDTDPEVNKRPFTEDSPFASLMPQPPAAEPAIQEGTDENEESDEDTQPTNKKENKNKNSKNNRKKKNEATKSPRVEEIEDDDSEEITGGQVDNDSKKTEKKDKKSQ